MPTNPTSLGSQAVTLAMPMRMPLNVAADSPYGNGRRADPSAAAAGLAILGLTAVAMTALVIEDPSVALLVPLAALAALVCARWPVAAVVGLFLLTGGANSLQAFFGSPVRPVANLALLGLWLGVLWAFTRPGDRRTWLWPGVVFPALYLLLTALEVFTADSMNAGFRSFQLFAFPMSALVLLALAPWPSETFRRIARGAIAVGLLVGLYGLYRWVVGPTAGENEIARRALPGLPQRTELRFFGSFPTAQQLVNWCSTLVPFALALALTWRGRWGAAAAAAAGLCAFLIIAASVLAGVFAVIAGTAVTLFLFAFAPSLPGGRRLAAGVLTLAAVALVAGAGYAFAISGSERSESKFSYLLDPTNEPTFERRQDRWSEALAEVDEHPFGRGLGTIGAVGAGRSEIDPSVTPQLDSSYLKIAFEQGMVVMVLFIAALVALLLGLGQRVLTTADSQRAALAMGACGSLVSLMVLFVVGFYIDHVQALSGWLLVGIGVAQFTSTRQREAAEQRRPAEAGADATGG